VLQGFCRIVTNPQTSRPANTLAEALRLLDSLIERPSTVLVRPGSRHWQIVRALCEKSRASGKPIAHAALAIESGCEWVTADSDFARFEPPLR